MFTLMRFFAITLSASPAPGEYWREGFTGTFPIVRAKDNGPLTFSLETTGSSAHTCSMKGSMEKPAAIVTDVDDTRCEIDIAVSTCAVALGTKSEACTHWCGSLASVRQQFKMLSSTRDFKAGKKVREPLLGTCAPHLNRFELTSIRNDFALTLQQPGDNARGLEALEPLKRSFADDPASAPEPAYEAEVNRVAQATRASLKICGAN